MATSDRHTAHGPAAVGPQHPGQGSDGRQGPRYPSPAPRQEPLRCLQPSSTKRSETTSSGSVYLHPCARREDSPGRQAPDARRRAATIQSAIRRPMTRHGKVEGRRPGQLRCGPYRPDRGLFPAGVRHHLIRRVTVAPILRERRLAPRFLRAAPKAGALTKLRHDRLMAPRGSGAAAAMCAELNRADGDVPPRSAV